VPVEEIRTAPGPGFTALAADADVDPVSSAINTPRRLLEPIVATGASAGADGEGR